MNKKRLKRCSRFLFALVLLLCVLVSLYIFLDEDRPAECMLYYLIPLSNGLFFVILSPFYSRLLTHMSYTLVIGLYFAKYTVVPFFTRLGGYATFVEGSDAWSYMPAAILLTCYEQIFVAAGLYLSCSREARIKRTRTGISGQPTRRFDACDMAVLAGTAAVAGILLYYPSLRQNFHLATQIGEAGNPILELRSWREIGNGGTAPLGIVNTLMLMIFKVIHIMLPLMLLEKIWYHVKRRGRALFYSVLVTGAALMVMTESNANSIFIAITLTVLLFYLYPAYAEKYAACVIAGGIGLVLILFVRKVNGSTGFSDDATVWNNLSITLNSYLNGPFNLSVVFAMREQYHPLTAITETLAELPAGGRLFARYSTSVLFNETLWGISWRTDQLIPAVGQGLLYFGGGLAPVIPLLFALMSFQFEKMADECQSVKKRGLMLFASVICAFLIGNNLSHCLTYFSTYFPAYALLFFSRYKVVFGHALRVKQ